MTKQKEPRSQQGITRRDILKYGSAGMAASIMAGAGLGSAFAQAKYPSRPVTVLVPYAAGGNTDTMARLACNFLSKKLGQNFVVENQPTAGGIVATETVARSEKDGYTLLFGAATNIIILPLMQDLSYSGDDITPISALGAGPYILAVRKSLGQETLSDFIAYAKANPGQINYAVGGIGGNTHLTMARFEALTEIKLEKIPYAGGGPATAALLAGEVDVYFGNASELLKLKDNPDIVLLAVTTSERLVQAPDLQTVAEVIPGFVARSWNGFMGPAGLPQEIVSAIEEATVEAGKDPEIRERLNQLGIIPLGTTQKELLEIIEADKVFYTEAVNLAGLAKKPK